MTQNKTKIENNKITLNLSSIKLNLKIFQIYKVDSVFNE